MALEKTVLNEEIIRDLLHSHYGITVRSVARIKLGSANCYHIKDSEKSYFLKEFQSKFTADSVLQEAALVDHLVQNGFPAARFYRTDRGEAVITYRDHLICLEEFIEGQTYGYNDLPASLLPEVARTLGRLHTALRSYPLSVHRGEDWLVSYADGKAAAQYDALLTLAAQSPPDACSERIIADLQYKRELVGRCAQYLRYHDGITYTPSHGDFQGCQLVWQGNTVKAVIDFSSARTLPAVWEIMRSYVQSSAACRAHPVIEIDALCAYVMEYLRFAPLTRTDLTAMPYVYLCQLARSRFGYTQYLTTDSEDRMGLLDFALWRTAMCREVEAKAKDITTALNKLV